jgi:TRAP-type C4-dicarboxylate transport system substrate-binding protein
LLQNSAASSGCQLRLRSSKCAPKKSIGPRRPSKTLVRQRLRAIAAWAVVASSFDNSLVSLYLAHTVSRASLSHPANSKLQNVAAANGLRIVTWWWMRGGFALTAPRAITSGSLSGLKFQTCGLVQDLLVAAGARPGDEPASEVPMLLDMGALDGAAMPYEEIVALRLHEHAKFATIGGPSLVTCFSPMLMSKKTWDQLSPMHRRAIAP